MVTTTNNLKAVKEHFEDRKVTQEGEDNGAGVPIRVESDPMTRLSAEELHQSPTETLDERMVRENGQAVDVIVEDPTVEVASKDNVVAVLDPEKADEEA